MEEDSEAGLLSGSAEVPDEDGAAPTKRCALSPCLPPAPHCCCIAARQHTMRVSLLPDPHLVCSSQLALVTRLPCMGACTRSHSSRCSSSSSRHACPIPWSASYLQQAPW